jgi:hypothetical protein
VPLREEAGLPPTAMESDALGPAGLDEDARQALRLLLRGESPSRRRRAGRPGMLAATGTASPVTAATSRAALTFAPRDFETHCGVALRGLRVADAVARNMALQVGSRRDAVQAALPGRRRVDNVVLVLEDRSVVVVPVLAGYVTSLSFDGDGLLDDVACEPAAATAAARAWSDAGESMRRLRAVVAGTSRLGVFRLDDEVVAERLIERLRADSAPDAAMAVLAAYALHDRRMRESIRQLHGHLTRTLGAGIFDVALLAFALTAGAPPVYPCVPMLTQGWSLLAPLGVSLPGRLGELSGSLRPSLWTHFAADAAAVIIDEIRKGKVE